MAEEGLEGLDIIGGSLGARLVLEMARRGRVGATVALDLGRFWGGWERTSFRAPQATWNPPPTLLHRASAARDG